MAQLTVSDAFSSPASKEAADSIGLDKREIETIFLLDLLLFETEAGSLVIPCTPLDFALVKRQGTVEFEERIRIGVTFCTHSDTARNYKQKAAEIDQNGRAPAPPTNFCL